MDGERIRQIGERLRGFGDFAQGEYIYIPVSVSQEDYYFDLGVFGEQSASVSVEDDSYQLDADNILDKYPIGSSGFLELAEELEGYEDPQPEKESLDSVLARMEGDGEGPLARAVRAFVEAFRENAAKVGTLPLPPVPLPWPGALRDDIDYTAPDFPLRYQPPPGHDWAEANDSGRRVSYERAQAVDASRLRDRDRVMVLDNKGRVTWGRSDYQPDQYESGIRWALWYLDRDGIPSGMSFSGSTWPRAIGGDGSPLVYPEHGDTVQVSNERFYGGEAAAAKVKERVREIAAGASQVSYDPLTVVLVDREEYVDTTDLRLGDDITGGSFGRVISVEPKDNDQYLITMNRNGTINTSLRTAANWSVLKISRADRESQPTALSLSASGAPATYDPLTVPLLETEVIVKSNELRVGDDITGSSFGRVVAIENDEIVMNRDGTVNRTKYNESFGWSVKMIDVPDRDSVPTAAPLVPVF